jgi:hypothetical protein
MHDLVRAYCAELAAGDDEQTEAITRMLDHYVHTAYAAVLASEPHR